MFFPFRAPAAARFILCFVTMACAFGASAPGRAAEPDAALVQAAKKEGKLVFYASFLGTKYHLEIIKGFEAKYGIPVELLDVRASEMVERIRTEQTTGKYIGDVVQNGAATLLRQEREGELQPHGDLPNTANLIAGLAATDIRVPNYMLLYGILVNSNLVKPEDEPKSWNDLADAKWKGKILSDDMRAIGGGQVMFSALADAMGKDYLKKLGGQDIVFSRDVGADERRVARGEFPMRIPQLVSNYLLLKGLPVRFVMPKEGAPYIRFDMAILKGAPHINAARLFMNYYLSDEAQLLYAQGGLVPLVNGVADKVAPALRALEQSKLMGTTSPDTQDAMLALARDIFK